jgi:hypothetical protein
MWKLTASILFLFLIAVTASAQPSANLLKQLRKIKLLESTRIDVGQILYEYKLEDTDRHLQSFEGDGFELEIKYATGECSDDPEESFGGDVWAVDESKVEGIEIELDETIKVADLGFTLSKFTKEQKYAKDTDSFIFHDKAAGIVFETNEKGVLRITFFPPRGMGKKLCKENDFLKQFYSTDSWFDKKLEERHHEITCYVANVNSVELSVSEIAGATSTKTIDVTTDARDPENDVLTYVYAVSAGQIKGTGPRVVWDLTGVPAGTYTITAGVDDGCGLCGKTFTRHVVIK